MSVSFVNVDAVPSRMMAGVVALAIGLGLVACGDDDEPMQTTAPAVTGATDVTEDEPALDPASDRAAIRTTLEAVLTRRDPREVCAELVTESYLRESYGGTRGCEAAQVDSKPADRVRLSRIVVLPDSLAQALAEPTGGLYNGDRLRAELVLDTGIWKLDSLRSNVPVGP